MIDEPTKQRIIDLFEQDTDIRDIARLCRTDDAETLELLMEHMEEKDKRDTEELMRRWNPFRRRHTRVQSCDVPAGGDQLFS